MLILNLTRPLGSRVPKHLCTEDAANAGTRRSAPRSFSSPISVCGWSTRGSRSRLNYIEDISGSRTLAAEDLMTVQVGKTIRSTRSRGQELIEEAKAPVDLDR